MDIENVINNLELTDEIKTELTGRLGKFKEGIDSSYTSKLAEADSKLKDAITSRQKAKERVKELEDKITAGDFEGIKETKALAEKYKADYEGLTEAHNNLKSDYETQLSKLTEVIKNQKAKILEKIPDNLKPSEALLEKMGLEDLSNYHEGLIKQNVIVDKSKTPVLHKNEKSKTLAEWKQKYSMS